MLNAVSGVLTKQGVSLWSTEPTPRGFCFEDVSADVARELEVMPLVEDASGEATVVTYTVLFEGEVPSRTVLLCDLGDGHRTLCANTDPALAATAMREELCGRKLRLGAQRAIALG
jgi:acetyl-CoA C-acetyltransferase